MDSTPLLLAQYLTFSYGTRDVIVGLSFDLRPGEIVTVTGPNGAGKSTLLDLIAGDIAPRRGRLDYRRPFGLQYLPQSPQSFGRLTCKEAATFVLGLQELRSDNYERFRSGIPSTVLLDRIDRTADTYIWQVSGGERQALFLSLTLSRPADLYLLDEPFNSMDADARQSSIDWIRRKKEDGATVVLVTHNNEDVGKLSDRSIHLAH
jgi:ABC-type multidrug transport system ATPase subunit